MSLLDPERKAMILAMDHARTHGTIEGLEDPGAVIDGAIEASADAIMTTFGVVKHYRERMIGRIPVIMRLDGASSLYREDWLAYTEWHLLHSVEDALTLGVDGVIVNVFMGISVEATTYKILAKVAGECMRANLPVMVEDMPCPSERVPDPKDGEAAASAARLAFEHGADMVKTYYTGSIDSFRKVTTNCPVPVLIAGGPKMNTTREVFQSVHDAMQAGASGVVFGRNIWQSDNMPGMIGALKHIIHDNGSVNGALDKLA